MNNTKNRAIQAKALNPKALLILLLFSGLLFAWAQSAQAAETQGGFAKTAVQADDGAAATSGGFKGPGPAPTTVAEVLEMRDDQHVTLRGNILESLGGHKYVFKDATGTIVAEIGYKKWKGQTVTPEDTVEIRGEIDKDHGKIEIEVKELIKQVKK